MNGILIVIGLVCVLWAAQQARMTLVYMGVLYSPVVGPIGFAPSLVHAALRDAVKYFAFGVIFLYARSLALITYLVAVLLVLGATDLILALLNIGVYGSLQLTPSAYRRRAALELFSVAGYALIFAMVTYLYGW